MRDENGSFDLHTLSKLCDGELIIKGCCTAKSTCGRLVTDSRNIAPEDVFVAVNGRNTDGELFCAAAFKAGAAAVVCRRGCSKRTPCDGVYIETDDPVKALQKAAEKARKQMNVTVIGITGSAGKTTVKELCKHVLSQSFPTDGTEENKNNCLGLPLTVLNAFCGKKISELRGKYPQNAIKHLVLEAGISQRGEMETLARIACPNIVVVTNIGSMHTEGLGSRMDIAREKLRLASFGNCTVLYDGCEELSECAEELSATDIRYIPISGSVSAPPYARITSLSFSSSDGSAVFDLEYNEKKEETPNVLPRITAPFPGRHGAIDCAYAALTGLLCGVEEKSIRRGINSYSPLGMRQQLIRNGALYRLADCYNSGPESVRVALAAMAIYADTLGCKRRVAVLGSMLELGDISRAEHYKLGTELTGYGVGLLFCVGAEAAEIGRGAATAGFDRDNIYLFETPIHFAEIKGFIDSLLKDGDIVLYKGSRALGLERLLDEPTGNSYN